MNDAQFSVYWELLCERHRPPSAALTRLYALTIRGEGITADEWAQAVALSLRFDEFMPSIQKLIDYARPGFKAQALGERDACLTRARAGEVATLPNTITRTLMQSVTNGRPLGEVPQERLDWVKREFLERYAAHLTEQAKTRTLSLTAPTRRELPNASD